MLRMDFLFLPFYWTFPICMTTHMELSIVHVPYRSICHEIYISDLTHLGASSFQKFSFPLHTNKHNYHQTWHSKYQQKPRKQRPFLLRCRIRARSFGLSSKQSLHYFFLYEVKKQQSRRIKLY